MENNRLQTLNMGCNPVGAEGMAHAKDAIARNRSLLRLGLQATKLNCQGAISIAEAIAENPCLLRVDLRENPEIKSAGLLALHLALKINTSITSLNLDRSTNLASSSASKEYGEQFRRLYDEIQEFCERNRALYEVKLLQEFEETQRQLDDQRREEDEEESAELGEEDESSDETASSTSSKSARLVRDPSLTCADSMSLSDLAERKAALSSVSSSPASPLTPVMKPTSLSILTEPGGSGRPDSPRSPGGSRFKVSPVSAVTTDSATAAPVPDVAPLSLSEPSESAVREESPIRQMAAVREVVEDLLTFCVYEVGDHPNTPSVAHSRASIMADFAAATTTTGDSGSEVRSVVTSLVRRVEAEEKEDPVGGGSGLWDGDGEETVVTAVVAGLVRDAVRLEREEHREALRARKVRLQKKLQRPSPPAEPT